MKLRLLGDQWLNLSLRTKNKCEMKKDWEDEIEFKIKQHEEGLIDIEEVQEVANKAVNIKYKAEVSFQDYKHEVDELNNLISEADKRYKPSLDLLQKYEERRIDFVKATMQNFMKYFSDCNMVLLEKEDKFSDSVKMINSRTDLQIFVDEYKSKPDKDSLLTKMSVQIYEPQRKRVVKGKSRDIEGQNSIDSGYTDNDEFVDLDPYTKEQIEATVNFVKIKLKEMVNQHKELNMEEKADLLAMLHHRDVNYKITQELKLLSDVKEYHVLKDLSELVNYMINESINDNDNNFKIITNILQWASTIYWRKNPEGQSQTKKRYLSELIRNHALWTESSRWKAWIHCVIEEKKLDNLNKKKKIIIDKFKKLKQSSTEEESNSGMFSKFLSRITKPLTTFELDHELRLEIEALDEDGLDERTCLNIIFTVLSTYVRFLSQFAVELDLAKSIILFFCEKEYSLDRDRIQILLSELESTYANEVFTDKEKLKIELQNLTRIKEEMKHDSKLLILYYVSSYLDNDKDLVNILNLNKSSLQLLKPTIYRRWLLNIRNNIQFQKRSFLWRYFLNLDNIRWEYEALKDKINKCPDIIEKVEEVIFLDVQRSFNNTKSISRDNLSNILKTYAFYNPEIEYCQGMNFLAGFFYFYFKDEEKAFKCMLGLIEKFNLTELFNSNLPRLKLYFYVLDRLISIYLPDLHDHFKNEFITSSLFSSAWFITWFWNSISHQSTAELSENLLLFWDNFIIDGYLVIFQVAIILLGLFEEKLMPLSFEEMLNYIVDIPKILFSKIESVESILIEESSKEEIKKEEIEEEIVLFEHTFKKSDVRNALKDVDFPTLLKNSTITIEIIHKLEQEYRDNEEKGNFS